MHNPSRPFLNQTPHEIKIVTNYPRSPNHFETCDMLQQRPFVILSLLITLIGLSHCSTPEPSPNYFSDPSLLRIAQFQDQRNAQGLLPYMKAKKEIHRRAAMRALGSMRDTAMISYLTISMMSDVDPETRMLAAYAIGQLRDSAYAVALMKGLNRELDIQAQVEMLTALGKCANLDALIFLSELNKKDHQLMSGQLSGLFHARRHPQFQSIAPPALLLGLFDQQREMRSRVMAGYALAAAQYTPDESVINRAKSMLDTTQFSDLKLAIHRAFSLESTPPTSQEELDTTNNPYHLAQFILSDDQIISLESLRNLMFNHRFQVVRTSAAESYFKRLASSGEAQDDSLLPTLIRCLQSRDMGLISHASIYIHDHHAGLPMDELLPIVEATLADLHAPRQLETIYDVKRLQAALQGKPFEREPVAYNHPINWEEVKQIPRNQTVRITTSKGDLILQLHVESAPGSVWNFLNTVRAGEYNGRYFHRVVPNFVIQGGCPRGDGWGAPDWTQRSEFSNELRYERGSVGLASVGEDTEGVQFFITHCATPHLDGRYTIFATVIDGLEVIDMIHVGDQILSVEEIKSTPATQTSSSH